jgi:hypothetical protein
MDHRIQFLRDSKGQPVGCVAIQLHQLPGGSWRSEYVTYQVSVLHPQDRFNRAMARQLALGKLAEAPFVAVVPRDPSRHEITTAVFKDICGDTHAPNRARKAARLWLSKNAPLSL